MAPDAPWDLLARYLAGEATPTEQAELRAWASQRPEHQAILRETTAAWEKSALPPSSFAPADVDRAWHRFETQVWGPPPAPPVAPSPTGWLAGLWKTAGLMAVGVGAGWWLHATTATDRKTPPLSTTAAPMVRADSAARHPASSPVPLPSPTNPAPTASTTASADLVFDNTPLPDVADRLTTAFGVRVVLADTALRGCRFTGTFHTPQPEQVLHVVSVAISATFTQLPDGTWELRGNGCPPGRVR